MAENIYQFHRRTNRNSENCDDIYCKFIKTIKVATESANQTSTFNITNTTSTTNLDSPRVIGEKNHSKASVLQIINTNDTINGSITINGPIKHRIHFTPKGLVIDKKSSYPKKSSKTNTLLNSPLKVALENLTFIDLQTSNTDKHEYNIKISNPSIHKKHSTKKVSTPLYQKNIQKLIYKKHSKHSSMPSIYALNTVDQTKTFSDPKNPVQSVLNEKIEQHSYLMGCFRVIVKSCLALNLMQFALIDERLGRLVNQGNPGKMANYFDTIAMSPLDKITHFKDGFDNMHAATLNKDIVEVHQILFTLPNKQALVSALNLMHPAKIADIDLILCNNHSLLYSNIGRHFDELECSYKTNKKFNIWGKAFGTFQSLRTIDCITGYNDKTGGIFVGMDYSPIDRLCFGSGFSFTLDNVTWHNRAADALLNTYYGFLYSSLIYEMASLETIGSLSYTGIDGNRYIRASTALQRTASAESGAMTYYGRLKGSYNFILPYKIELQLFDAVDLGNVYNKKFTEQGASALNLHVNRRHSIHLRNEIGIQFSKNYFSKNTPTCWTPTITLKWVYQNPLSGNTVTANFQHQSSKFTVQTRNKIINQISPSIALIANSSDGLHLSAYYEGAFGNKLYSNELGLHIGKNF